MNQGRWFILASILIVSGLLLILTWLHKPVTLLINGESTEITTYSLRVGDVLQRSGIEISEGDQVIPDLNHWIWPGEVIQILRASVITIRADGVTTQLVSPENNPANLLVLAGVRLYPGDQIWADTRIVNPDSELRPSPSHFLEIRRQWPVTVEMGKNKRTFKSHAATLGEALWEAGYRLYAKDRLTIPLDTPVDEPISVQIRPSKDISIRHEDGLVKTRTSADTVGEALARAGMPLQGMDYSRPPADDLIPSDGEIRVIRVRESIELETSPIPFETLSQPSPDLPLDQQQVVQEGSVGLKATRLRVRFEDGEEVARTLEGEFIARQPSSRILGYGTKIVAQTLDTPDGPIEYWRALNMYAVSYNPTSNGGYGTASGIPLAKGVAAIDNDYILFGTRMYIPGYGIAVAADTGGGVKGRMIDLGYSDDDYVSWHQWVTVYFLWPPPENVPWIIP